MGNRRQVVEVRWQLHQINIMYSHHSVCVTSVHACSSSSCALLLVHLHPSQRSQTAVFNMHLSVSGINSQTHFVDQVLIILMYALAQSKHDSSSSSPLALSIAWSLFHSRFKSTNLFHCRLVVSSLLPSWTRREPVLVLNSFLFLLFVCLWVCLWVCYHDNWKLHISILTKLDL